MSDFRRYAVYYLPPEGPLAALGGSWLGWDCLEGREVPHPDIPDLSRKISDLTAAPRKYGFHGTIKPPFKLAEGTSFEGLAAEMDALCAGVGPVFLEGLELAALSGFVALRPVGDVAALGALAGTFVKELDAFRRPPDEAELARRRARPLTETQDANLVAWGYPYVLDEFRFHMTLTGRLPEGEAMAVIAALRPHFEPILTTPHVVGEMCLAGEAEDGRFHLIHRYALSG